MIEIRTVCICLISAITLGIVSCKDKAYEQRLLEQERVQDSLESTIEGKTSKIPQNKFETISYEGCEYLIYKEKPDANSAFGFMAHKGNCSNPIHKKP
ncbi:MAG: hypothetical protein VX798_01550 [Bacteroidota bacterium]|uniref:Uncharacterized protein n=1 Tax=Flagellimonas profundi TaxID=2915620 RepID=A0ABS3FB97_9FLAO|nr:hypothetical protein [Allomuricauda profundi]MBO0340237.1 hypothetical protein [Allomuricauda profundi]MEC7769837.1 hypothetical protein [Bacteroidota bacterium]